jgi:hypothetical protein
MPSQESVFQSMKMAQYAESDQGKGAHSSVQVAGDAMHVWYVPWLARVGDMVGEAVVGEEVVGEEVVGEVVGEEVGELVVGEPVGQSVPRLVPPMPSHPLTSLFR